jgi:hypothetical protein
VRRCAAPPGTPGGGAAAAAPLPTAPPTVDRVGAETELTECAQNSTVQG